VSFGQELRELRRGLDLTQAELANRVGCGVNAIRKLEAEERRPSRDLATRLASILGLDGAEQAEFVNAARGIRAVSRASLPSPVTRLIGREMDRARLRELLLDADVRLVTLTGPPGVGKTRLALQIAIDLQHAFRDGALFVPFAGVMSPGLVMDGIAEALGIRARAAQPLEQTVQEFLRHRHVLLVLDNFEHVLPAAESVATLLSECGRVSMVISSREALKVYGEHVYEVPALGLPGASTAFASRASARARAGRVAEPASASELLFLERASAVRPACARGPDAQRLIAGICTSLQGLPLAIELAAGRAGLMGLPDMQVALSRRLDVLEQGPTNFTPRQRSMRGAIDWSYSLLSDGERRLLCRTAVFASGATLEAIRAVASEPPAPEATVQGAVESLANKSLLTVSEVGGTTRFGMLEVIREYALEQLQLTERNQEQRALRRRHAAYFAGLAERGDDGLRGSNQVVWSKRLDAEHDNFRSALQWSLDVGDAELAGVLCCHLWPYWRRRGNYAEGRRWLTGALGLRSGISETCRAGVLNGLGVLTILQGDYAAAEPPLALACQLSAATGDLAGLASASSNLGWLAHDTDQTARAERLFEESLRMRCELGDVPGQAASFDNLGMIALERRDLHRACELFGRSADLSRPSGDSLGLAQATTNLGWALQELGDYRRATRLFSESLAVAERLEWPRGIANNLGNLALMAVYAADYTRATDLFLDSVWMLHELEDRRGIAESLEGLAGVAGVQGQPVEAARLFGAAEALREQIGAPLLPTNRGWVESLVATGREQLADEAWTQAWTEGRGLSLETVLSGLFDQVPT
jgi:predicted ATPase/DNA-binding XRE family transcriptional regulator